MRKQRVKTPRVKRVKPQWKKSPLDWTETFRSSVIVGGSEVVTTVTPWVNSEPQRKEWENIPNFRDLIKTGQQATGDFRRYGTVWKNYLDGYWWCTWMKTPAVQAIQWFSGPYLQIPTPTPVSSAEWTLASNRASRDFVQKLRSARTQVQGAAVIGELRETIHEIHSLARGVQHKLLGYLEDLLRTKPAWDRLAAKARKQGPKALSKVLAEKAKFVGNKWLEVAFAIKPTLMDAKSVAEAFARNAVFFEKNWVYINSSGEFSDASCTQTFQGPGRLHVRCEHVSSRRAVVKYKGVYDSTCIDPVVQRLSIFGFQPEEWVPSLYELCPYSWALDYFTNVNEIIDAWAYRNASIPWLQYTAYRESQVKTDLFDDSARWCAANGFAYKASGGSGGAPLYLRRDVMRFKTTSSALQPKLVLKVPGMPQAMNLAALAFARLKVEPF